MNHNTNQGIIIHPLRTSFRDPAGKVHLRHVLALNRDPLPMDTNPANVALIRAARLHAPVNHIRHMHTQVVSYQPLKP
jgi:hypothetical protein